MLTQHYSILVSHIDSHLAFSETIIVVATMKRHNSTSNGNTLLPLEINHGKLATTVNQDRHVGGKYYAKVENNLILTFIDRSGITQIKSQITMCIISGLITHLGGNIFYYVTIRKRR